MLYLPLDKLMEKRLPTLTLDEQRQAPSARAVPQQQEAQPEAVEPRRERGSR
jgi:hypothetical protein